MPEHSKSSLPLRHNLTEHSLNAAGNALYRYIDKQFITILIRNNNSKHNDNVTSLEINLKEWFTGKIIFKLNCVPKLQNA